MTKLLLMLSLVLMIAAAVAGHAAGFGTAMADQGSLAALINGVCVTLGFGALIGAAVVGTEA